MKDYIIAAERLEALIELATNEDVPRICEQLNSFWKSYCETDVQIFWFVRWTRHNHAAKGAWTRLDYCLRCKLKELNLKV